MLLGLWTFLTVLAGAMEVFFVACVFVYIRRLERRNHHPLSEQVGAHKAVLAKLRKRQPLSPDEFDYAAEVVSDARSPLAYAIPAALFTLGFFYVVGCLQQLQVHGGSPSFRTYIGGLPMLSSLNIAAQLRRVGGMKRRLQQATVTAPSDEMSTV